MDADRLTRLKRYFPDGGTVYVITISVARTGLSRRVRLLSAVGGEITDLTGTACGAGLFSGDMERGALVRGGGMDMHWLAVEVVARAIGHKLSKVSL